MTGASSSNGSCTLPAAQRSAHPQHTQSPDPGPFSPGFVLATEGSTAHVRPCSSTASTQQPHSRRTHCAHTDRKPPEKTLPRTRRISSRPTHAQRVPGGRQRALQPRVLARGARVVLGARERPHLAARQPGVVALPIKHAQQLARPARRRQVLCPRRLHLRAAPLRISSCTNEAVITRQPRAPCASSRRLTTGAKKKDQSESMVRRCCSHGPHVLPRIAWNPSQCASTAATISSSACARLRGPPREAG